MMKKQLALLAILAVMAIIVVGCISLEEPATLATTSPTPTKTVITTMPTTAPTTVRTTAPTPKPTTLPTPEQTVYAPAKKLGVDLRVIGESVAQDGDGYKHFALVKNYDTVTAKRYSLGWGDGRGSYIPNGVVSPGETVTVEIPPQYGERGNPAEKLGVEVTFANAT